MQYIEWQVGAFASALVALAHFRIAPFVVLIKFVCPNDVIVRTAPAEHKNITKIIIKSTLYILRTPHFNLNKFITEAELVMQLKANILLPFPHLTVFGIERSCGSTISFELFSGVDK